MEKQEVLYLIMPAYNEEANLGEAIRQWYPIVERHPGGGGERGSRLVIVDDGSRDNTLALLREAEKQYPLLHVVAKENGGHGSAVLAGYRYAVKQGADYIFQTDSDLQTNPEEFEGFWRRRTDYDAIFGRRRHRGDGFLRKCVEAVLCLVLRVIFGVKAPDANCPFRLMRREGLVRFLDKIPPDYFLPNALLTAFYLRTGKKVLFLDVSFGRRTAGTNSIRLRRLIPIGVNAVRSFLKIRKTMGGTWIGSVGEKTGGTEKIC